jgi:purine-cytosine permease-like protein
MKLLGFVALYGLALMPMGAVIFCDFWMMQRLGMQPFYAERSGKSVNWAPALAWLVTVVVCLAAVKMGYIGLYFASLPGWFVAAAIYLLLSKLLQQKTHSQAQAA